MDEVPVLVPLEDRPDSPIGGTHSAVEVKPSIDLVTSCRAQLSSEAIVFSFWIRKNHPELKNFLIPSIAVSKKQVAFCFYDCENDILLETPPINLTIQAQMLDKSTIVTLWLVLNYKYLCSGVLEEMKKAEFNADFFIFTQEKLEKYRNCVMSPCYGVADKWFSLRSLKVVRKQEEETKKLKL